MSSTQTEQVNFYILEKNLKPRNAHTDGGNDIILTKHIWFLNREVALWSMRPEHPSTKPGMETHTYDLVLLEMETGGLLELIDQCCSSKFLKRSHLSGMRWRGIEQDPKNWLWLEGACTPPSDSQAHMQISTWAKTWPAHCLWDHVCKTCEKWGGLSYNLCRC